MFGLAQSVEKSITWFMVDEGSTHYIYIYDSSTVVSTCKYLVLLTTDFFR